jgi:CHAT domain-containing protein
VNIQRHGGAKECAADYVVSSYVPTIAALIKARAEWKTITRQDISALVVHESTPGQGYTAIKAVDEEARMIRERLEAAQAGLAIDTSTAPTVLGVLQTLQTAKVNVLHLACHGIQDVNPLKSAFILKDGRLSIQELMKLDLHHAAFAFLSACQTAKGDERQPDQAVHLAASLLFCGFRSVIGTLW